MMPAMAARYATNTAKALEVILWLSNARPGVDIYHVVKCAFYADKYHVDRYGRPIAGDDYVADTYGPLGAVVYGLLRNNPLEILALQGNGTLPFRVVEGNFQVVPDREPNLNRLSGSDVEALSYALENYGDKSFDELFEESHSEPAYIAADGGRMHYEHLLPADAPNRKAKIEYLIETAPTSSF